MYRYLLKKLWCIIVKFFTGIMAAYRLPNLVCIYPTDGPRIYPVVFWHYTVVVGYCFSLCVAVFFSALVLFTVKRWSHY